MKQTKARVGICFVFAFFVFCAVLFFPVFSDNSVAVTMDKEQGAVRTSEFVDIVQDAGIPLTVNGTLSAHNRDYDGTTIVNITFDGTLVGLNPEHSGVTVAPSRTGNLLDKNAGNNKDVYVNLTGPGANLYSLVTKVNINKKAIDLASITVANKVYDGADTATVTAVAFTPLTMPSDFPAASRPTIAAGDIIVSARFKNVNAGKGRVAEITDARMGNTERAGNFTLGSARPETTAEITKRPINLSGVTARDKVFDGRTNAEINGLTFDQSGLPQTVISAGLPTFNDVNIEGTFARSDVGTWVVSVASGATIKDEGVGANFLLSQTAGITTTAKISRRTVNVAAINVRDKPYDATNTASLAAANGIVFNNEDIEPVAIGSRPSVADIGDRISLVFSNVDVGTWTVSIESIDTVSTSNFNIGLDRPTTTAIISKRTISLSTISAQSKVYDGTDAATVIDATFTNAATLPASVIPVIGVDFTITDAKFTDINAGVNKTVRFESVSLKSTPRANNFSLGSLSPTGTAEIIPRPVEIVTITAKDKVFDGTNRAVIEEATFSNVDTLPLPEMRPTAADLIANAIFSNTDAGTWNVSVPAGAASMGTSARARNFSLFGVLPSATASAKITPRPTELLSITVENKVYDGTNNARVTNVTFSNMGASVSGDIGEVELSSRPTISSINIAAVFGNVNVGSGIGVTVSQIQMLSSNFALGSAWSTVKAAASITQRSFGLAEIAADGRAYDGTSFVNIKSAKVTGLGEMLQSNYPVIGVDFSVNGALDSPNVGLRNVTVSGVVMFATEKARNFKYESVTTPPTTTITVSRGERPKSEYVVPELRLVYKEGITLLGITLPSPWQWHGEPAAGVLLPGIYNTDLFMAGNENVFDLVTKVPILIVHSAPTVKVSGSTVSWNNMPNNAGYGIYLNGELVHTTEPNVTEVNLSKLGINADGKNVQVRTFGTNDVLHSDLSIVPAPNRTFLVVMIVLLVCAGLGTGGFFGLKHYKKAKLEGGQKIKWNDIDEDFSNRQGNNYVDQFLRGKTTPYPTQQIPLRMPPSAQQPSSTFSQKPPPSSAPSPVSSTHQPVKAAAAVTSSESRLVSPAPPPQTQQQPVRPSVPPSAPTAPLASKGTAPARPVPIQSPPTAQRPPAPPPTSVPRPTSPPPSAPRPAPPPASASPRPTYPGSPPPRPYPSSPYPGGYPSRPPSPQQGHWFD